MGLIPTLWVKQGDTVNGKKATEQDAERVRGFCEYMRINHSPDRSGTPQKSPPQSGLRVVPKAD